ncbi:IS66 family transposase [Bradyrhizobium sp. BRP14]|nr:IS66 family transposase [Bradyrhizobium sp. BRP14]
MSWRWKTSRRRTRRSRSLRVPSRAAEKRRSRAVSHCRIICRDRRSFTRWLAPVAVCGGSDFIRNGEAVTEVLDYVPASFRVVRHVQPRFTCKGCDTDIKATMPSLPIERGKPGGGLVAHVLTAKYCDHLPLYRQSEIYVREGVDLFRSTMADWVGKASALLEPLVAKLRTHVFAGSRLHGDDTPVPVLEPGNGKTKTGRLWTYVRDGRAWGDEMPPAVSYFYSPDRKGEHPKAHLASFSGTLHADGYAGFRDLYEATEPDKPAAIQEAACWAHVRRKFFDLTTNPGTHPIAEETLERIGDLYDVENAIRGAPPDRRKTVRQSQVKPKIEALCRWWERCFRNCRVQAARPRRSAMRLPAGRRSAASSTTAPSRSTTTPPSGRSGPRQTLIHCTPLLQVFGNTDICSCVSRRYGPFVLCMALIPSSL